LPDGHVLTARQPTVRKGSRTETRTVEVTGLTKRVSQELLIMYFENEAKSGGGNVEDVQIFDESTAYITFESSEGTVFTFQHNFSRRISITVSTNITAYLGNSTR